jgi:hypothetical protein
MCMTENLLALERGSPLLLVFRNLDIVLCRNATLRIPELAI